MSLLLALTGGGGGVTGDAATSQTQTISASGSSAVAAVTGIGALSQAQTIAGTGTATVASVSGTTATSQAQTIVSSGASSPASVSGVAATSQAETITGSGSFAGAGVVSGDAATSQAQTVTSSGLFVEAAVTSSGEVILQKRRYYVRRHGKILLFNTAGEADAFIEQDAEAEKVAATKTSRLARKRVRDAVVANFTPEVIDIKLTQSLVDKFDLPSLTQFINVQNWEKSLEIQALALEMEEEEDASILAALPY